MEKYPQADTIQDVIDQAQRIVIMQASNPDGDSLGSALALEEILSDLGKSVYLYCGVDIPSYLRYLPGWDRVSQDFPSQFDATVIVDTSTQDLFDQLNDSPARNWVATKPCVVLDHHAVEATIPYASVICNQPAVATGEVIYELARQLDWPLNHTAMSRLATSIMSDSLGLTTEATSARSITIIAELVAGGVSIAELEQARRELMRKKPELVHYKGELLQRVEYHANNRIASVTIPFAEIEQYSPDYNPSMLVIDDMRMTIDTEVAIAFKIYNTGRITAKIRCNYGTPLAGQLAEHFGGGGHAYAAGFKVQDGRPFNEIKSECIKLATELLDKLEAKKATEDHETLQHADA